MGRTRQLQRWGVGILVFLALSSCQPLGRTAPPDPPGIRGVPAATHQSRITLSGTKPPGSLLLIDGAERVPRDASGTWTAEVDLPVEGLNTFRLEVLDDLGQISSPVDVGIVRDRTPPNPPPVTTPETGATVLSNPLSLAGTKEAGALIRLNGRRIAPATAATTWSYEATLTTPGSNTLNVTAIDAAGNESAATSVPVNFTPDAACTSVTRPTPIFPLDRAAIRSGAAFTWQSSAARYRFQLANSPAFDGPSIVRDVGPTFDTSYPVPSGLTGGVYYWRVGAVDACGISYGLTRSVIIGSTTGDVTGDGYADVLVGAPGVDSSDLDAGAAYLYPGGTAAPLVPAAVFAGQTRGDLFGNAVAKAGDLDRDGYVDVLVGAYAWDRDGDAQERTGRAYLFWGGPAPATKPAVVFTGESSGAYFGLDVKGVGDVNGDGYPDVAVGGYRTAVRATCGGGTAVLTAVGRVYVYFGGPRERIDGIPDVVLTGETLQDPTNPSSACRRGDEFGGRLAGAGDVNGDGYDDIVVGARGYDLGDVSNPSGPNAGRAYIFYGGPWLIGVGADQADVVLTGSAAGDEFGEAVAGLGDADGDGFADVLVGAPLREGPPGPDSGAIYRYYGGASGPSTPSAVVNGQAAGDNFGFSVAGAGDVDADGLADAIVGAFLAGPGDNGSATVYDGSGALLVTITGEVAPQSGDWFGGSVSGAGDVDGDGRDDVAVGAYRHDECSQTLRCEDAGRAYVFKGTMLTGGGTTGAGSNPASEWIFTGLRLGDGLGMRVD